MRVYYVPATEGWDSRYFPTREAALQFAQMVADHTGAPVEVEELSSVPLTADVLCRVLNGLGGWCASEQLLRRVWPAGAETAGTREYGSEELE